MATEKTNEPILTAKEGRMLISCIDLQIKSHDRAARAQYTAGRQAIGDQLALEIDALKHTQSKLKMITAKEDK